MPGAMADDAFFIQATMIIFTPTQVSNGQADGQAAGDNRVTSVNSIPFASGIDTGDVFKVIWIDATALGGSASPGMEFGTFSNAAFVIPGDGATVPFSPFFTELEPLKQMTEVFSVPEPSSALLGLFGPVGLLLRRL